MLSCNVKAREKSFEGRVAINEGGDILGTIFNDDPEGEDKEREKKKGEEIGCEGGCSFSEKLRRTAEVIEARVVVGHSGGLWASPVS